MNKTDLIDILTEMAEKDIVEGHDIHEHPCSVAVRAINKCFEDIKTLQAICPKRQGSRRAQMLTGLNYNPEW